jgi:hypothetical protein
MKIRYLLMILVFFYSNSIAQQNTGLTHLSCTGSESWTSYWKNEKGDEKTVSVDFTLFFNSTAQKVSSGTSLLAQGCFISEIIEKTKSTCDCKITDELIECKSKGYRKDSSNAIHLDEFSINRRTATMSTFRQWLVDTKIKQVVFGNLQCIKVEKKF